MREPDYDRSWQMFNLNLTWLIDLFVVANLSDLPSVEIGMIAKLEKRIKLRFV